MLAKMLVEINKSLLQYMWAKKAPVNQKKKKKVLSIMKNRVNHFQVALKFSKFLSFTENIFFFSKD